MVVGKGSINNNNNKKKPGKRLWNLPKAIEWKIKDLWKYAPPYKGNEKEGKFVKINFIQSSGSQPRLTATQGVFTQEKQMNLGDLDGVLSYTIPITHFLAQ